MDRPARRRHARAGAAHRHVTALPCHRRASVTRRACSAPVALGTGCRCSRCARAGAHARHRPVRPALGQGVRLARDRRRSRTTSPSIPACCGSSRARSSGAKPAGRGRQVLRLLPRRAVEPEGRRRALSRLRRQGSAASSTWRARIQQCRAERQKAAPLAYESQQLLALTALVAHQSRGLPMSVAHRRAGAAVLRGGPRALLRAPGPARPLLRAMPRRQLGQAAARRAHQPGPRQRLSHLSPGVADAGLAAPPPARLLPGRARRALPSGAPELVALELYLAWRAQGLPIETPAVRR